MNQNTSIFEDLGIYNTSPLTYNSEKRIEHVKCLSSQRTQDKINFIHTIGLIKMEFFYIIEENRYYALFWKSGELFCPKGEILYAHTWETLKNHIEIKLRDADFIYFIGFFNKFKVPDILKEVGKKFNLARSLLVD